MSKIMIQLFGGRGSGSSSIPTQTVSPGGNGVGNENPEPMDQFPGAPSTVREALGEKGRPMSTYNAVMKANPFYDGSYREYSENCQRAAVATEARFRGYDVIAQPTYDGDDMPYGGNYLSAFKNAKSVQVGKSTINATLNQIEKEMKSYGNNSRALLRVVWKGDGSEGHVLNVLQRNGKTIFVDGQIGKQYNAKNLLNAVRTKETRLVRVDNLEFGDRVREAVRQSPNK